MAKIKENSFAIVRYIHIENIQWCWMMFGKLKDINHTHIWWHEWEWNFQLYSKNLSSWCKLGSGVGKVKYQREHVRAIIDHHDNIFAISHREILKFYAIWRYSGQSGLCTLSYTQIYIMELQSQHHHHSVNL